MAKPVNYNKIFLKSKFIFTHKVEYKTGLCLVFLISILIPKVFLKSLDFEKEHMTQRYILSLLKVNRVTCEYALLV